MFKNSDMSLKIIWKVIPTPSSHQPPHPLPFLLWIKTYMYHKQKTKPFLAEITKSHNFFFDICHIYCCKDCGKFLYL